MLTDEEGDILYGQSLLHYPSSEALINTLWLNNTQFFGLRGCQEHRDMRCGHVEKKKQQQTEQLFWARLFVSRLTLNHDQKLTHSAGFSLAR